MRIVYLGVEWGTSGHRMNALRRLGHDVRLLDVYQFISKSYPVRKLHHETGGLLAERKVTREALRALGDERFDVAWVDWGHYVGPSLVKSFQQRGATVINYNVDDPLGRRDRLSGLLYRKTLAYYDLVVVVREENVAEAYARGARKVLRVYRSADELAHAPREVPESERATWASDVLFVGTYFPERGSFMAELIERGVPLSIHGDFWQKSPYWPALRPSWKGPGTTSDDPYAKLIQGAKICLGLLSKGNRDLHTTRSLEIPLIGGLFCAERTSEHLHLYREGEEAVFWSGPAECADVCMELLADEPRRRAIAEAGRRRCVANGTLNEPMMQRILDEVATVAGLRA